MKPHFRPTHFIAQIVVNNNSLSFNNRLPTHFFVADNSTVFSNGCTIGEVGLNEIRLVPISERRQPTFSSADLGRMQAGNRNSYAAPSSNTTITTNGTSPPVRNGTSNRSQYSSTNSLNSFESVANMQRAPGQPVPPMRKKRAAPRPPSQHVIPEDSPPIRQMSFHVSSPNLSQNLQIMSVAGNKEATPRKQNGGMRPVSMFPETPLQSAYNGSAADLVSPTRGLSRSTSNASDMAPGAAPRRKKAAPAPPPRVRDSITPQPAPRSKTPVPQELLEKKGECSGVIITYRMISIKLFIWFQFPRPAKTYRRPF